MGAAVPKALLASGAAPSWDVGTGTFLECPLGSTPNAAVALWAGILGILTALRAQETEIPGQHG